MAARTGKKRKYYARTKASREKTARRGLVVLLSVVLCIVGLAGIGMGMSYIGSLFFSRNPHFELKNLVIRSDGRLSSSQLMEYSGLQPGLNLFEVDIDTLRNNLGKVPLVESVSIRRKLPDTLFVDVKERVAVAQVSWKWRAPPFLIDRHGVVLPPTRTGQALPLIEGLKLDKLRPGEKIDDNGVQYVLTLLEEARKLNPVYEIDFERFDLRYPDHITATLSDGASIRFPRHSAESRLRRLIVHLQKARELGKRVKTADLVPDGINTPIVEY